LAGAAQRSADRLTTLSFGHRTGGWDVDSFIFHHAPTSFLCTVLTILLTWKTNPSSSLVASVFYPSCQRLPWSDGWLPAGGRKLAVRLTIPADASVRRRETYAPPRQKEKLHFRHCLSRLRGHTLLLSHFDACVRCCRPFRNRQDHVHPGMLRGSVVIDAIGSPCGELCAARHSNLYAMHLGAAPGSDFRKGA
jgi:hypothetical protein